MIDTILTTIYFFAALTMSASVCLLMLHARHGSATYSFIGCQISIIIWLTAQLLQIQSESLRQLENCYLLGNFGICFIGSFWLLFAVNYLGGQTRPPLLITLFGLSLLFFAAAASTDKHGLYYAYFGLDKIEYGPLFYLNQAYIYLCLLAGLYMVCRRCFEYKDRSRGQAASLSLALLIPLTVNLLTLNDVIKTDFALTPLTLSVSSLLVLLATYRYGFLNVNAVAFEDALNVIEEGAAVFSRSGRTTYFNSAAVRLLGVSSPPADINEFLKEANGLPDDFENGEITLNGRTLDLKKYVCRDGRGVPLAFIVIISDITGLLERTAALAAAEQRLAIEQERNRIAQEVHDTAGHTLTMISSLAKLSLKETGGMPPSESTAKLGGYAAETEALARSGITQLRCSINDLRSDKFLSSVTNALNTLADSVRDMKIELCIRGEETDRYKFCVRAVYDCCRELITNCERYSAADKMDIIIKFEADSLALYVFDNGGGCEEIKQGNGLHGISERITALGGTVRFVSAVGEGFRTIIKIPVDGDRKEDRS